MKETKISIFNDSGEKLVGIETIPSVIQETYPTVLLVHGFGVTKEEIGMFDELSAYLAKENFLVYRFDFSGCGESEGDYSESSLSKLTSDLSKILEFVKSQPKVDASRIGILGQSFGTAVVAALEPKVTCLVMMGAISRPKERFVISFGKGYNPEGISTKIKSSGLVVKVKPQFWKDFDTYNLLASIKRIHCPILFIHGEKDKHVALSEMENYFENANEPKEKIILEGMDHSMEPHREKMYTTVAHWFRKYLV